MLLCLYSREWTFLHRWRHKNALVSAGSERALGKQKGF